MPIYFVYVRFLFDNVKKTITSTNVKAFRPDSVTDFTPGDMHKVYWEGNAKTKGGYYDAELLHMTESKEEMDSFIAGKRVPPLRKRKQPVTAPKTLKKCRLMAKEAVAKEVLTDLKERKENESLKKEIFQLKRENGRLHSLNMRLQEQLLRFLSKTATQGESMAAPGDSPCQELATQGLAGTRHPGTDQGGTSPGSGSEPGCSFWDTGSEHVEPLGFAAAQLVPVPAAGLAPAAVPVLAAGPVPTAVPVPAATPVPAAGLAAADECVEPAQVFPPACPVPAAQLTTDGELGGPTTSTAGSSSQPLAATFPVCTRTENGKVHLANGVTIDEGVYNQLMAVPKDSHFVKRSASAIWSTEVLAQRSFSGTLSNRTVAAGKGMEPQKQLTPHKVEALKIFFRHYAEARGYQQADIEKSAKNLRLWLSQKTSELRRRRPEQQATTGNETTPGEKTPEQNDNPGPEGNAGPQ